MLKNDDDVHGMGILDGNFVNKQCYFKKIFEFRKFELTGDCA